MRKKEKTPLLPKESAMEKEKQKSELLPVDDCGDDDDGEDDNNGVLDGENVTFMEKVTPVSSMIQKESAERSSEVLDLFKKKGYFDRIRRMVCLDLEQKGDLDRLKIYVTSFYEETLKDSLTPEMLVLGEREKLTAKLRDSFERYITPFYFYFYYFYLKFISCHRREKWQEIRSVVSEKILEGGEYNDLVRLRVVECCRALITQGKFFFFFLFVFCVLLLMSVGSLSHCYETRTEKCDGE
jgi:hypothetical protein